jgi:ABC-2 type transport system ATP-binding protein
VSEARLAARGVTRTYGGRHVVEDVDLDLHAGEVLALIGPNGGGKSTLLMMMAGLVRPSAGTIAVDGVPTHELAIASTGSVGLITAVPGLYPSLTGQQNLEFFGGLYGLGAAEVTRRAAPLIEELGLGPHIHDRAAAYSSGMQQKLSLLRARLLDPKVLLLDEPTANLDPIAADTIYRAIRHEADRGIACALVTHDLHAAEDLCDRVAVVRQRIRATEPLPGARRPPPTGRLFALYREHAQ